MSKQLFEANGAIIIPKIIPVEFCHFFTHILLRQADLKENQGDNQVPSALTVLSYDTVFETLQERLWPNIENIVEEELLPTYSYARLYSNNDKLDAHTDRPACEISLTIQLGRSHNYAWPIYANNQRFDLAEGDAVLYKGCEISHWRNKCEGPNDYYSGQVFIHFVKKNGQYADHYKDLKSQPEKRSSVTYTRNRTYLMEIK